MYRDQFNNSEYNVCTFSMPLDVDASRTIHQPLLFLITVSQTDVIKLSSKEPINICQTQLIFYKENLKQLHVSAYN